MKVRQTLCALVGSILVTNSCDNSAYEEQFTLRGVEPDTHFQELYDGAQAVVKHTVPFVELTSKKSSLTLDLSVHVGNAVKAQKVELPVTEAYFSGVSVGDELSSKFNTAGLIIDWKVEDYKVSISDKSRRDVYYLRDSNGWEVIDQIDYDGFLRVNSEKREFAKKGRNYLRKGVSEDVLEEQDGTCEVTIKSRKINHALDASKFLQNDLNTMEYSFEVPGFIGEGLEVGTPFDHRFVWGSLGFSSSLSSVVYDVIENSC